ncbi:autotransporter domain-containing protein [Spiribacter roseus]|uniref:Autotransporter domain-containing protein n=1 Tax=Spiribacter roseus TaxID=1855875 RepID=A0ABV3RZH4_9GAMM
MSRAARPKATTYYRHTPCALMIAAAMQIVTTPALAERIIVRNGDDVTTTRAVINSLTVESGGTFTSTGQLRLEGDASSRLSSDDVTIQGNVLALNDNATLTLDAPNVFGTSSTPTLVLSTKNNTDLNDTVTTLVVAEDMSLIKPESDRGRGSVIAGDNADIEIISGATLKIERGVANIRGTLSGDGDLHFKDSDKNFIAPPDGEKSTHTGNVLVEQSSLTLGAGALANSATVTFRDNRTDLNNVSRTSIADADSLKNGVNLIVENDAFLQLDGKNRPTITHTADELTVGDDSEIELTSKAKLRAQEATIAGDISGTGTLIFNGGRESVIKDSGTTFAGTTQVIDRSTLTLETSGALGNSDTLSIAGGATVNTRAGDVFNDDLHLWFQTGDNRLDIQGAQTVSHLTLPESSTIAFTSNSSTGNDQLTLTSTTEESVIRGDVSQNASGDLILNGAKANLYSQTSRGVTVNVKNGGELAIERENAVQGTLDIGTGGIISVNANNGLNTTSTNSTLILPKNAQVNFNADQTLDRLSATRTTSQISIAENATLSIANTTTPKDDSLFYGKLSGGGDLTLTGGGLLLGAAGVPSPANALTGAFNVTGGATLELNKDEAISGDTLTVSDGSRVSVKNGGNAVNANLDVTLTGDGDRIEIETFSQETQRINRLMMGADSALEIKIARGSQTDKNTLVIGANDGDSEINGAISGPGNLTLSGSGTTVINRVLEVDGEVAIDSGARVSLATAGALGSPGTLDLSAIGEGTLAIDAANGWEPSRTLNLPSASTLEVNADQRIDVLQARRGKSRSGPAAAADLLIADNATLTLGTSGETLNLEGLISGGGNLVFADGTTKLGSRRDGGNPFTGTTTVENSAALTLTQPDALGASRELSIQTGGSVSVDNAIEEDPFNNSMRVNVQGDLQLAGGNSPLDYQFDRLDLDEAGRVNFNNNARLTLTGDSSIAGTVDGTGTLVIGGNGTTVVKASNNGGLTFTGELRITDSARVSVDAQDGLDVRGPIDGSLNVSIGSDTTLDLNVENAFKTLSEAGHTIAEGARVNVNARDAVSPQGDFSFADDQATLAINDVAQTLNGELAGSGKLVVTEAGDLTLDRTDGNPGFDGSVSLEDTATLTLDTDNALGTATLTGDKATSLVLNASQEFAGRLRFGGNVSGAGTLVLSDTGRHSVPDNLDAFTGSVDVQAGSLALNTALGTTSGPADATIGGNATLSGTGTITGVATLADGATHAPGNSVGTQTVGTYNLADGATLEIELDTDSRGALINDLVEYTNSATLGDADGDADGPTIDVTSLDDGLFIADGTTVTVVTGDGVSDLTVNDPINITEAVDLLTFSGAPTAGEYTLTAQRTAYTAINPDRLNDSQRAAADALDQLANDTASGTGSDPQSVLLRLDALGQAVLEDTDGATTDYQAALSSLSGARLLSADAAWFEGARRWSEGIDAVIDRGRGLSADHPFHVSVYADRASTDGSAARPGFDRDSQGFVLSAERAVSARGHLGAALGYERAESDFDRNGGHSDQQNAHTAIRYAFAPRGDLRLSATALAGLGHLDTDRPIATDDSTAHSDPNAWQAGLLLNGEHRFAITSTRRLTAMAGVGYLYADRDGFSESGDATLSLQSVAARSIDSLTSRLGLAVSDRIKWGQTTLSPSLRLVWVHDFSADEKPLKAKLAAGDSADDPSSSIRLTDHDRDADRLRLDTGIGFALGEHTEARIGYQAELGEQSTAHQARAGLTVRF